MTIQTPPTPPGIPNQSVSEMNRLRQATGAQPVAFGPQAEATTALAKRLFEGPERWGWEYAEPQPPGPYPHLDGYPQWVEPLAPDLSGHQRALALAKLKLRKRLMWAGGLAFLALLMGNASGGFAVLLFLSALGIGGYAAYQVHAPQEAMRQAERQAAARRTSVHTTFLDVKRQWDERIAQHDEAERTRVGSPLLFPLAPGASASRVDVVGGTAAGWTSLLATMGSSTLAAGGTLLVLDLSRNDVTGPLSSLAAEVRAPHQWATVPAALEAPWLLGDLKPRRLADVLAAAIDSMRGGHESVDLVAIDAEIIRTVATRIERPLTFARLAAGIQVLRQSYDMDEETALSPAEVAKIADRVDVVAQGEKYVDELRFIEHQLGVLADSEDGARGWPGNAASLWPIRGLAVLRSDQRAPGRDARSVVDRVVFQAVARQLASTRVDTPDPTLVVVGADDLGRAALEEMARNAYRARVRLVYLFEHLKRDALELLGGGDSVAVLMRMGNGDEAQKAAEFIGQGFTFQVSQLSKQVGTTVTNGTSQSTTETNGSSYTYGTNRSRSWGHHGGGFERGVERVDDRFVEHRLAVRDELVGGPHGERRRDAAALPRVHRRADADPDPGGHGVHARRQRASGPPGAHGRLLPRGRVRAAPQQRPSCRLPLTPERRGSMVAWQEFEFHRLTVVPRPPPGRPERRSHPGATLRRAHRDLRRPERRRG